MLKSASCRQGMELAAYMRGEGYNIIPITAEHQLAYACNVLNLGGSRIISVHRPSARQIARSQYFRVGAGVKFVLFLFVASTRPKHMFMLECSVKALTVIHTEGRSALARHTEGRCTAGLRAQGEVRVIDFSSITSMYGSVHCASQVVRRTPKSAALPQVLGS
jgi:N-dimethylarginine dimethylaminohydrolase